MSFEEYWEKEWADAPTETADRTFGEEVWKDCRKDTWKDVFQIVSDKPQFATREFIKELEAARDRAGAGL